MNKTYEISDDLKRMIGKENVVWNGKPKKSCFVLECIFNPALGFSIIWFLFDMIFMSAVLNATTSTSPGRYFVLIFISLHMMPVWMYLGGIISSIRKYRNTEYVVTDRGIYITGGFFAKRYDFKPFTDLSHVNVNRGVLDQFLGVGDVISECHHGHAFKLIDLPDYLEVCNLIKQYQTDIYADTQFPNGFRPTINSGYQTSYLPYERAPRNASYSYQDNYFNQPVDNVRDYSDNRIINNTINRPYNGNNSFNASSPYNRDNTYNADSSYNNNTYNNSAYNTNSSYSTNNTYSADSSYSKDIIVLIPPIVKITPIVLIPPIIILVALVMFMVLTTRLMLIIHATQTVLTLEINLLTLAALMTLAVLTILAVHMALSSPTALLIHIAPIIITTLLIHMIVATLIITIAHKIHMMTILQVMQNAIKTLTTALVVVISMSGICNKPYSHDTIQL